MRELTVTDVGQDKILDDAAFAHRIGVKLTTFRGYVSRKTVPIPDFILGTGRGWSAETVEDWIADRPGQGARTDSSGSRRHER